MKKISLTLAGVVLLLNISFGQNAPAPTKAVQAKTSKKEPKPTKKQKAAREATKKAAEKNAPAK